MIRVALTGLGSIWRHRVAKDETRGRLFAHSVYYNTTGVLVNGHLRTRPRIVGHLRFNGVSGLDPNYPSRAVHRTFDCAEPCIWKGQNKLLFERVIEPRTSPDLYLVVARSGNIGMLDVGSAAWRSSNSWVISFSEDGEQQEVMLLMAADSWIRTQLGMFVVEPEPCAPWVGRLRLHSILS
jgi:hypothetical protein